MAIDSDEQILYLRESAIDSLKLAIELYNRPHSTARKTSVLMLLGHAFEMLLKASIVENGGDIHTEGENNQTIGFKKAISVCRHGEDEDIRILEEDEVITLNKIRNDRDSATHYLIDTSEQQLYVFAEAGVTLFDNLLDRVFNESLADHIPGRVLPLSTSPPQNLAILIDDEYTQVRQLLDNDERVKAKAKLRSIEGLERALDEDEEGPVTDAELDERLEDITASEDEKDWTQIFRGVASLDLTTEGEGEPFRLEITKSEGVPVNLVDEEDEDEDEEATVAVKRVNERDFYNLGIQEIAEKFDEYSWQKLRCVADELGLQENEKYYKEISVGSSTYKRYSGYGLKRLREAIDEGEVDPEEAWEEHGW